MRDEPPLLSAPEAIAGVVRQAIDAYRGNEAKPLGSALKELYDVVLRLTVEVRRLTPILASASPAERDEISVQDQQVLLRFFDLVREFDERLSKVDIAVIDIYQPELVANLTAMTGFDNDVLYYFNKEYAPKHGLDLENLPPSLAHFLSSYSSDFGYWNDRIPAELKAKFLGGSKYDWFQYSWMTAEQREQARAPGALEHSVGMSRSNTEYLIRLVQAFDQVRRLLGDLVRSNWTLQELASTEENKSKTVEINVGDVFSNVSGSTIVNRSTLEDSFNSVTPTHGQDMAEALRDVAQLVEDAHDPNIADLFNAFTEELRRPQPRKSTLKTLWDGLMEALPSLVQAADLAAKVASLFN